MQSASPVATEGQTARKENEANTELRNEEGHTQETDDAFTSDAHERTQSRVSNTANSLQHACDTLSGDGLHARLGGNENTDKITEVACVPDATISRRRVQSAGRYGTPFRLHLVV